MYLGILLSTASFRLNRAGPYVSVEPLIGHLDDLDPTGLDWVAGGGESRPGSRLMQKEWVTDIRGECLETGVPFFFKQWGGVRKKQTGRLIDGITWDQMPKVPH